MILCKYILQFIITKEKAAISANKLDVTSVVIAKK